MIHETVAEAVAGWARKYRVALSPARLAGLAQQALTDRDGAAVVARFRRALAATGSGPPA